MAVKIGSLLRLMREHKPNRTRCKNQKEKDTGHPLRDA